MIDFTTNMEFATNPASDDVMLIAQQLADLVNAHTNDNIYAYVDIRCMINGSVLVEIRDTKTYHTEGLMVGFDDERLLVGMHRHSSIQFDDYDAFIAKAVELLSQAKLIRRIEKL